MDHGPNITEEEHLDLSAYKSRIGLILSAVYSAFYVGFILINTFVPRVMSVKIVFGLNLAVLYGFGLIVTAIVLGLVYNNICSKKEAEFAADGKKGAAK